MFQPNPYLSSDIPLQPLRTWQVGVGVTAAVTLLSVSQLNGVHRQYMLQCRVVF